MRDWGIGTNNRYKTAHIYLETGPFWAFLGRDLSWILCDLIPAIPFPKTGKIVDEFVYGEVYNWNEWYGDLNSWWHIKIDDPLYGWFDKFIKIEFVKVKYYTAKRIAKKYP